MRLLILFFLVLFLPSVSSFAEDSKKYDIQLVSPFSKVEKGKKYPLALWIKLYSGWYTYWSYAGDFGKNLTTQWQAPPEVSVKDLVFPTPQRYADKIGKEVFFSFIYKKSTLIPFEIFIPDHYEGNQVPLSVQVHFFICREVCISKTETLEIHLDIAQKEVADSFFQDLFQKWQKKRPQPLNVKSSFKKKDKVLLMEFSFEEAIECLDIFPRSQEDFSTHPPKRLNQSEHSCTFEIQKSSSSLPFIFGLLTYKDQQNQLHSAEFKSHEKKPFGLIWFIFMAFLGGLILNIMPCVLPIIFLKFYNTLEFINQPRKKIITLNLSYVAGVISSFLVLALMISLSKQAGQFIGWGFHLQSPLFVTVLALLFMFMGFYLLNWVSFSMPQVSLSFKNEKILSHFVTGVLSTTAASPCTVPFMASAVGFAFSRTFVEVFIIFFFLGLGLSFPYIVLAFFPSWLAYIPHPKTWMDRLKTLFSIPLFMTVLWLIYLIRNQLSSTAFWLTLLIFPLALFCVFLNTISIKILFKKIIYGFAFVGIVLILSAQYFLKQPSLPLSSSTQSKQQIQWLPFSQKNILEQKEQGQNILVVIGAKWCLTCKINELIFKQQEVIEFLKENDIHAYYGDWTNRDKQITQFLESYGQQGIPFSLFYKGKSQTLILPTLFSKKMFLQKINQTLKGEQ